MLRTTLVLAIVLAASMGSHTLMVTPIALELLSLTWITPDLAE